MRRKFSVGKTALAFIVIVITVVGSGCGQKGDLYIPHNMSASSS